MPRHTRSSAQGLLTASGRVVIGLMTTVLLSGCVSPDEERTLGSPTSRTGIPAETDLQIAGGLDLHHDGTVVEDLDIRGCVRVFADDVVIRRSRISCTSERAVVVVENGAKNLRIEDSEVDGLNKSATCVGSHDFRLLRTDVHSCFDGVRANSNTSIIDSWVHGLVRTSTSHNDAIQTTQGRHIVLQGNVLEAVSASGMELFNAAYIVSPDQGPVHDVVVRNNRMNGGNYTVMIGPGVSGMTVEGNVVGPDWRYGPVRGAQQRSVTWVGNRLVDGSALDAGPDD